MGKVTFEFDEDEERSEINLINNRHKLICALYDLQKYRRNLYKGYINNATYVVDGKIVGKWEEIRDKDFGGSKITSYLCDDDVINEIDAILSGVSHLLD